MLYLACVSFQKISQPLNNTNLTISWKCISNKEQEHRTKWNAGTVWWLSFADVGRLWERSAGRDAQLPKFTQTGSTLISTISTHDSSILLSWGPLSCFLPSLSRDFPASLPCQTQMEHLISQRLCFMRGLCAALPWHTARLHSDYKHLNTVWQPFPREGLTIMFH